MTGPGGAEFALVAACSIWPQSERRQSAIVDAVEQGVNWNRLLRVARRQRVEGLVVDGLRQAGIAVPPAVAKALAMRAEKIARQNAVLAAESLRLQKQFDDAGIANLILKGATLAVLAYDNPFVKAAWDIDILVEPQDKARGIALLESAGFIRLEPKGLTEKQFQIYIALGRECIYAKGGTVVEIKWHLSDNPELLKGVCLSSSQQLVKLGETQFLRTLGKDDLFAYLCVHGATHCWARLKWIGDLGALLERESLEKRERLYHAAEARGAGPSAAQALLLCRRLLGTQLPPGLAAWLDANSRTRWLASAAMFAMTGGPHIRENNHRRFVRTTTALSHFLMGRGRRFLTAELGRKWVSLHDHVHVPLPRWAHFLYPVIRMPLFVWRRIYGSD